MIKYKTRAQSSPQDKAKVYFSCHEDDFCQCFQEISNEILEKQNCTIYYYEPDDSIDYKTMEFELSQMDLAILPVTTSFLLQDNRAKSIELPIIKKYNIPVLPLMQERGIEDIFNQICGNMHSLNKYHRDATEISYDEKLDVFLNSVLVSSEMRIRIRNEFVNQIFLSYRKKDRELAQRIMNMIYKCDEFRDVAIWYDEFLVPGRDFETSIADEIGNSQLLLLVVTKNIFEKNNYVLKKELPEARRMGVPILATEVEKTDRIILKEIFEEIQIHPDILDAKNENIFIEGLKEKIKIIPSKKIKPSAEHEFLIGMAYLTGVCVEKKHERGVALIKSAADVGLVEAIEKLVSIYRNSETENFKLAITYQEILVNIQSKLFFSSNDACMANKYLKASIVLAEYYLELTEFQNVDLAQKTLMSLYQDAKIKQIADKSIWAKLCLWLSKIHVSMNEFNSASILLKEAIYILEVIFANNQKVVAHDLASCYNDIGGVYAELDEYEKAEEQYKKAINIRESVCQDDLDINNPELGIEYTNLGCVLQLNGKYKEAEDMYLKAFEITEKLYNKKPRTFWMDFVRLLEKQGRLYSEQDKHEKSIESYKKLIAIEENIVLTTPEYLVFSKEMISVADDLFINYASLARENYIISSFKEAKQCCGKAIQLYDSIDNQNMNSIRNNRAMVFMLLGAMYNRQGCNKKAESMYLKAIDIQEELKKEKPKACNFEGLSTCYHDIGDVFYRVNKYHAAREMYIKSIELREFMVKAGNENMISHLIMSYNNAGKACDVLKRYSEAEDKYLKALRLLKKYSIKGEGLESVLENLINLYEKTKQWGKIKLLINENKMNDIPKGNISKIK